MIWSLNAGPGRASLLESMPAFAERCDCHDEDEMLAHVIGVLRALPATWGYNIADEPTPDEHARVAAFTFWAATIAAPGRRSSRPPQRR